MNKFLFYWTSMGAAFGIHTANNWMTGVNIVIGIFVCMALAGEKAIKEGK